MTIDVVLLGFGAIGRELARQLAANARPSHSPLRVCGVIDTSGYVFDAEGISWRKLMSLSAQKAGGTRLADCDGGTAAPPEDSIAAVAAAAESPTRPQFPPSRRAAESPSVRAESPVLVDLTAADTTPLLDQVIGEGWNIVLANKVPLTGPAADVERLRLAIEFNGGRLRYEATVGAGLPVIDTLQKLFDSGDRVTSIEGCPSGTLGFLFGELGRGHSFSSALAAAIAAGYTEPDPRDDLCGLDVARKALILGRLLGFRGDLSDVSVESLVPQSLANVSRSEFLARVSECDAQWQARVARAKADGKLLRYRARVTRRSIAVGLVEVAPHDPLGALEGTDNQFAFSTLRYRERPLVITGPGAGPAVTAAGVYTDLLSLAGRSLQTSPPHSTWERSWQYRTME